ncbi:MAG: M20/M25/M40 family metallo-hydrolase [Acidobacteria bacterium]|nr:M20/M25/M40 family metallo-hydrolase [Acidobacteriota bacterium]
MSQTVQDVVALARSLVAIESTTGNESAAGDFLLGYLRSEGWDVERLPVDAGRWNLFARRGDPKIIFSTHIDTVPPFVLPAEDDAFIYGRGACDAKGILAAQVSAAAELLREGMSSVGLLFVVGEERNSAGAMAANQWILSQPFAGKVRFLINGEPTENKLALGTKGSLRCLLEATGRSAHSAYPQLGVNAIEKLLDALQQVRKLPLRADPELGGETVTIGTIVGGTRPNVVPDSASAEVMFRLVSDSEPLKREMVGRIGSLAEVRFEFEVPRVRFRRVEGFETAPMAYTTDIPFLSNFGEPLLLGPGSVHDAHTLGEKISKKELIRGVQLYAQLARRLSKEL